MIQRKNKFYKTGNYHLLHFTHKYRVHVFIVLLCLLRFYHTGILHASDAERNLISAFSAEPDQAEPEEEQVVEYSSEDALISEELVESTQLEMQQKATIVESSNEDTSLEIIWDGAAEETEEEVEIVDQEEATEEDNYKVQKNDNLTKIAEKYYGDSTKWRKIYEANEDTIGENPDFLKEGLILIIPEMHQEPPDLPEHSEQPLETIEAPIEYGTIIIISDSTVMRRKKWFWLSLQATFQLLSKDSTEGNFAIAIGCDKEVEPHIILPPYEPGESSVLELNKAKSIVGKLGLNSTVQDAFYILGSIPGIVKETKFDKPNVVLMIGTEWSYGGHAYTDDLDLPKEKLTDTINSLTIVHFSTSADDINNDFYDGLNEYMKPLKENAELEELHFRYGKNKDKDQEDKLVKRINKILLDKTHSNEKRRKSKRDHRKPLLR